MQDLAGDGVGDETAAFITEDEYMLRSELTRLASLTPRIVEIELFDGPFLQIGIGSEWAFAQHLILDPWKAEVALSRTATLERPESVWFVCGGQGTEIPKKYLIPTAEAIDLIAECLRVRGPSRLWEWELV